MKHITSMILTLAMLASLAMVSCEKDTQDPANTAGTTTPAVTTEAVSTTAETDAETEKAIDIASIIEGYTLHELTSEELEDFRTGFPTDSVLGNIAIKVTDYNELYLLVEDSGIIDGASYDRAIVRRIICGDTVKDCEFTFAFGPYRFKLLQTEDYTVVGNQGYSSKFLVFGDNGCGEIPLGYGRDGASVNLSVEDGKLCYMLENPIITNTYGETYKILDVVTSEDEWRYEWGTVVLNGNSVVLSKTKEQTMREDNFLRNIFAYGSQFDTLEELLEHNKTKQE